MFISSLAHWRRLSTRRPLYLLLSSGVVAFSMIFSIEFAASCVILYRDSRPALEFILMLVIVTSSATV